MPRHAPLALVLLVLGSASGCTGCGAAATPASTPAPASPRAADAPPHADAPPPAEDPDDYPEGETEPAAAPRAGLAVATFAGGCFWCMEYAFEKVPGVVDAVSGYTGGPEQHPSYDDVSNHRTQQAEAVRVLYDPERVTYAALLDVFFRHIDATATDRAFSDTGHQYRSAIFVASPEERAAARHALDALNASGRFDAPVTTTIEDAGTFWVAEAYHQNFYRTHPNRFTAYHEHSGRREVLRAHWGADADY